MKKKTNLQKPKKIKSRAPQPTYMIVGAILAVVFLISILVFKVRVGQNEVKASAIEQKFVMIDVPTRAVKKGESLKKVTFTKIKWPSSNNDSRFLINISPYSSSYAANNLPAYAPIPLTSIAKSAADVNAVVENIPVGYRAITVKVDIESIVEGWAQTGNYVDVIVLRRSSDSDLGMEAKLIAENVKILAAGATVESSIENPTSASAPATVTLLVSQEDALKVRTAATVGKLTFALRGVDDKSPSTTVSMNQKVLLGGPKSSNSGRMERRGVAKGPDGKTYILDQNSEWVHDLNANDKK